MMLCCCSTLPVFAKMNLSHIGSFSVWGCRLAGAEGGVEWAAAGAIANIPALHPVRSTATACLKSVRGLPLLMSSWGFYPRHVLDESRTDELIDVTKEHLFELCVLT